MSWAAPSWVSIGSLHVVRQYHVGAVQVQPLRRGNTGDAAQQGDEATRGVSPSGAGDEARRGGKKKRTVVGTTASTLSQSHDVRVCVAATVCVHRSATTNLRLLAFTLQRRPGRRRFEKRAARARGRTAKHDMRSRSRLNPGGHESGNFSYVKLAR